MQLSQRENLLLKDMQHHESLCIAKYKNYAGQAHDTQLKQLFGEYANKEQQHYDTISQLLQGQVPNMVQNQAQGQQQGSQTNMSQQGVQFMPQGSAGMMNEPDALLCSDALTTEKYVSGAYDTAVFEALNQPVRQALQHIQKEEQQHGEGIFNYMLQHGMYQVQ